MRPGRPAHTFSRPFVGIRLLQVRPASVLARPAPCQLRSEELHCAPRHHHMFLDRFHPRGFSPPRRFSRSQAPGFLHPMPDRIRIVAPLPSEDSPPPFQVARSSRHLPTEMRPGSLARSRLGLLAHGFPIRSHPSKNFTLGQQVLHHCSLFPSCRFLRLLAPCGVLTGRGYRGLIRLRDRWSSQALQLDTRPPLLPWVSVPPPRCFEAVRVVPLSRNACRPSLATGCTESRTSLAPPSRLRAGGTVPGPSVRWFRLQERVPERPSWGFSTSKSVD
jgi:hypothetical protein